MFSVTKIIWINVLVVQFKLKCWLKQPIHETKVYIQYKEKLVLRFKVRWYIGRIAGRLKLKTL